MSSTAPPQALPDTATRILDAAFECVNEFGLGRTTVEDVARAARLSRQTIYRYFPSKDHLVIALVGREEERFLDGIRVAFSEELELEKALRDGVLFCLGFARAHPLLDRLLDTDPQTLLPYLTTRGGPVIRRASEVVRALLLDKAPVRPDLVEEAVDAAVRVVISYVLSPPDRDLRDVAGDLAQILTAALNGKEASLA